VRPVTCQLARAVSIVGHPVVLVLVAALIAASTRGASLQQLRLIGGALVTLGVIVLGYSWLQVRAGRWSHVDASVRNERNSLNGFLVVLCLLSSALLWFLTRRPHMSVALALSGALIVTALITARWVKVSLHAAFAAFATALLWPIKLAVVAGVLVTAAVVWSRLVLGRHIAADVIAGLLLGVTAGVAYQVWVV
jgi:membrane-associated phospholipid phosphatase